MGEIGFQQLLDRLRRVLGLEVVIDLLPDIGMRTEAAAGEQMIALDGVVLLADRHLGGDQADIADVVLRAGMVAAGEMDVERRVDVDPRLAPVADLGGVALGVGGGELAAGIAGAGDQAGADLRGLDRKPDRFDGGDGKRDILVAHARDQKVLPDRQADFAVAEIAARSWPARASARRSACRAAATTPIQFRPSCFCLCTPICAMRSKAGRGASASAGTRVKAWPSFSSTSARNFSMPMPSSTYFSRALSRLVRSPSIDEHAHDGVGDLGRVLRLDDDAGLLGKILVAGDAADAEAKPDAGLDAEAVLHLDRGEGDVVGVFEHGDLAGAVEGDVELARQSGQRAVVEDVIVPFAGILRGCRAVPADRSRRSACP